MIKKFHTVICGSGPAGLAAALASVRQGRRTLLLEKNPDTGRKLLASGSGKCNFSNTLPEDVFMASFGRNGRFMAPALQLFGRDELLRHLQSMGVEHTIVDGMYYFPSSLKASDIRESFLSPACRLGLILKTRSRVRHLCINDNCITGVELSDGTVYETEKFIIAAGGNAMPQLGGSSDGLRLAEEAGHILSPPLPAMSPLFLKEEWIKELSGISLPAAEISLKSGNSVSRSRGTLLFTHDGLSGMAALNISRDTYISLQNKPEKTALTINFLADFNLSDYQEQLEFFRQNEPDKLLKSSLCALFPRALAAGLCRSSGADNLKNRELKTGFKEQFSRFLSAVPLTISQLCPMEKAMAMSGGVRLKDISPDTMQSRIIKGLYFAGEIIDLTGPCGGFNIQFALSSGYLAGNS